MVVTNLCLRHLFFSFKGDLTCVQDKKNLFWYNSGVVQWGHNSSFSCCKIKIIILISITSLSCEFTCSCRLLGMVSCFVVFCLCVPNYFLLQKIDIAEVQQPLFYLLDFMTNTCKLQKYWRRNTPLTQFSEMLNKSFCTCSSLCCMEIFRK